MSRDKSTIISHYRDTDNSNYRTIYLAHSYNNGYGYYANTDTTTPVSYKSIRLMPSTNPKSGYLDLITDENENFEMKVRGDATLDTLILDDNLGGFNIRALRHDATFSYPEDIHSIVFENNYLHEGQPSSGNTNTCFAFGGKTNPLSCVLRAGHFRSGQSSGYTGFDFYCEALNNDSNSRRAATFRAASNVSIIENDFYGRLRINGSQVSTSDDRVKHNEKPIINALYIINKLDPQIYDKTIELKDAEYNGILKEGTYTREAGLIAQDIYEIEELKSFVTEGDDEKLWSVNYNSIFTYGLAATKELDSLVQSQQTQINTLTAQNDLLKSKLNELLTESGKETIP